MKVYFLQLIIFLSFFQGSIVHCYQHTNQDSNYATNGKPSLTQEGKETELFYNISRKDLRIMYIEEVKSQSFLVKNKLLKQRLADVVYASVNHMSVSLDVHKVDSGNLKLNEEKILMAQGKSVDDELCGMHLHQMVQQIAELYELSNNKRIPAEEHVRLARVLDSFAHYDSGLLSGEYIFLGAYQQCITSNLLLSNSTTGTRYCIAQLSIEPYMSSSLRIRMREKSEKPPIIIAGVCLPSSCHTLTSERYKPLLEQIVHSQFKLPDSTYGNESLPLKSVFCLVDSDSELNRLSVAAKLFIIFILLWLCLVALATFIYRPCQQDYYLTGLPWLDHVVNCLSLSVSWNEFIENNSIKGNLLSNSINLDVANPIKNCGSVIMILWHTLFITFPFIPMEPLLVLEQDPLSTFLFLLIFNVETFFVITGALISYVALVGETRKPIGTKEILFDALDIIIRRFARLIPLYYLVFWFKKSIFHHLGSGPLWDFGINKNTQVGSCQLETWFSPVTFYATFTPLPYQCLPSAWTIACDLFFTTILSPIIILFKKKPSFAIIVSFSLIFMSNMMGYKYLEENANLISDSLNYGKVFVVGIYLTKYSLIHTSPLLRMSSYIIGCLVGYALYVYNISNQQMQKEEKDINTIRIKTYKWPFWFRNCATLFGFITLATALLGSILCGIFGFQLPSVFILQLRGRLVYASCFGMVLLLMMTDWKESRWMKIFASKIWKICAKLNFCILLVHYDLINYFTNSKRQISHDIDYKTVLEYNVSYIMLSVLVSLVLHLLFESPFHRLVRRFLHVKLRAFRNSFIDDLKKSS